MLRVIGVQIGLGTALAVALWSALGNVAGYSALAGCLCSVLPNSFLALRLAVPRRDPGAKTLIRAAYIGEIGKLALTVLMLSIVFTTLRPLAAGPFFAGFVVTAMVPILGFLMRDKETTEQERHKNNGE